MQIVRNPSGLSQLGLQAAGANDLGRIFDIIKNLWDPKTNPDGYVSLGVAENALMHETLATYIVKNQTCTVPSLTYGEGGMGSKRLRTAMASFLTRHLHPVVPIDTEHVVITNGCSSALEHCSFLLSDPGDGILLGQPYYGTFISDIQFRAKSAAVRVQFGEVDPISNEAVTCYEQAVEQAEAHGTRMKGLILCHPHNPLGRCYPREAIIALMKLCQKHQMHFISDEIYALSVWKNNEDTSPPPVHFVSALSIDVTGIIDPHLVHVLWGMSKDFGANGLRVGAIVSQNNTDFIRALHMVSLYSYPSSLADNITATLLEDVEFTDQYIVDNRQRLSATFSTTVKFLKEHNIEYAPGVNAGLFVWINLGNAYAARHPDHDERLKSRSLMDRLLDKKVFLAGGQEFGSEKPGWFRVVFAQEHDYLMEGLRRTIEVLEA